MGFGGGAPRSLLEYAKVAKNNGYDAVAVGQYTISPDYYTNQNIRTYNIPYFTLKTPISNFRILRKYLKIIKNEKPELIQVITANECIFQRFVSNLLGIPTIYTVPGGVINPVFPKIMENERLLVFSYENQQDLIRYGYDECKIIVNSNRILFPNDDECNIDIYESNTKRCVNLLFIGRIDSNYASVLKVLEMVELLTTNDYKVKLKVLGNGEKLGELKKMAEEINSLYNHQIISFEGFRENVSEYIEKAHIVFGKGRSIIDAISYLRVSFVVSESGHFFEVNKENVEQHSKYNFAGRQNNGYCNFDTIRNVIDLIVNEKFIAKDLKEVKVKTQYFYDIKLAEDKVLKIYSDVIDNYTKKSFVYRLVDSIRIIINIYYRYIVEILNKKR